MPNNGHWQFGDTQLDCHKFTGFVYIIKHRKTGVMYIGRKNFVMGGANRGMESRWREYMSSSSRLQRLIEKDGKDQFFFIALEQYKTLGGLGYAETWSMMYARTPERQDRFLNLSVEAVRWASKESITAGASNGFSAARSPEA